MENKPENLGRPEIAETEQAKRDLWKKTLEQIPTGFGRLVYLSSLRDDNTGCYRHFGLEQLYGSAESDQVLRESHELSFVQWINLGLEEQRLDLEQYLTSLADSRETVLNAWGSLNPYQALIPSGAGEAERSLYISDLEIILDLLRSELSG